MTFLPDGFEKLKTTKPYWKMSEMKEGDNKFRIVQKPIAGWLDWKDKKPHRFKPDQKPPKPFDAEKPIKPFWTCYVWDYAREGLFVLEITQNSVLKALTAYASDEDWGDFTKYDLKLRKEGSGKDTKYFLTPLPHKEMNDKIKAALETCPVRLEALYEGKDPWTDLVAGTMNLATGEIVDTPSFKTPLENLKYKLAEEGIPTDFLEEYIKNLSESKKQSSDSIIQAALFPQLFPKFKASYSKEMLKKEEEITVQAG